MFLCFGGRSSVFIRIKSYDKTDFDGINQSARLLPHFLSFPSFAFFHTRVLDRFINHHVLKHVLFNYYVQIAGLSTSDGVLFGIFFGMFWLVLDSW